MAVEPLRFRYRRSGWEREAFPLFAKRGEVRANSVLLDRREVLVPNIVGTAIRGNELVISVMTPHGRDDVQIAVASCESRGAIFTSAASNAACVKEAIDGSCSRARFEQRRQELAGAEPDSELRSETCPHCHALVDLSGFPPSPQVFCPYCGRIGTLGRPVPIREERWLRICGTCHYFGFPERVTLHRFATFWPVAFMFEKETATLCGSCMRTEAWINLRGNLLSVVGIPISAVELLLAHSGGSRRHKPFAELDRANEAATNEKPERAEVLYERLLDRIGPSAPLHYNRAKLRADHEDWSGAVTEAVAALADCSNFRPPLDIACTSFARSGRVQEAESLCARYRAKVASNASG
jgi:hypothetical protein